MSTKEAGFTFSHQLVFVDVGLCWGRGFVGQLLENSWVMVVLPTGRG